MTTDTQHRELFAEMVRRRDDELDLGAAALLIAQEEYPDLRVEEYIERLDSMGTELAPRIDLGDGPQGVISVVNRYLFDELGFHGDQENYFNTHNSFLNDVLDSRSGIPITLSVIYIEVCRRLGLPVQGVGLPGHFIVKYVTNSSPILIDPFHAGALLSREDCDERVKAIYGPAAPLRESFLAAATKRQILARILYNLKGVYLREKNYPKALGIVELLLALSPWDLEEIRDRGMIALQLRSLGPAREDLETYLRYYTEAPDAANVRQTLEAIRALERG